MENNENARKRNEADQQRAKVNPKDVTIYAGHGAANTSSRGTLLTLRAASYRQISGSTKTAKLKGNLITRLSQELPRRDKID